MLLYQSSRGTEGGAGVGGLALRNVTQRAAFLGRLGEQENGERPSCGSCAVVEPWSPVFLYIFYYYKLVFKFYTSHIHKMSGRALIQLSKLAGRSAKAAASGQMGGQAEALQTVRDMAVVLPQRLEKSVRLSPPIYVFAKVFNISTPC